MKPKTVDQPEMRQVEERLVSVLEKERRDAIGYTLLTVLCTPFFVVLAGLVALALVGFILRQAGMNML